MGEGVGAGPRTKGHTWHLSVDQRRSVCAFHVKAPKSGVAT